MAADQQLVISIPSMEYWDEEQEMFHKLDAKKVVLEHSLYTISKWERIWQKCFLKHLHELTNKEFLSYVRCMVMEPETISDDDITYLVNNELSISLIHRYMSDKMTASYVREAPGPKMPNSEAQTAELLYYYLIKLQAPVDIFEHWHINRLMALITVFNAKDDTKHKRGIKEAQIMQDNDRINRERRERLGSKG